MKKGLIVLLIFLAAFEAQARSVKLGDEAFVPSAAKKVSRPKFQSCTQKTDCRQGWKCSGGACVRCNKGETECNCAFEMLEPGICGCPDGKFNDGEKCRDYCDATVCEADYPKKINTGTQCCCSKRFE